jgi:hypothetical protein
MSVLDDPRYSQHLEATRGATFHFTPFVELQVRDDHAHCIACSREIAEQAWPDVVHEGYVTRFPLGYEGYPVRYQLQWVCPQCFSDFRQTMDWKLSDESPLSPRDAPLTKSDISGDKSAVRDQYAVVGWTTRDVVGIAHLLEYEMDVKQAERFLGQNELFIRKKATGAGYEVIQKLLDKERLPKLTRATGGRDDG